MPIGDFLPPDITLVRPRHFLAWVPDDPKQRPLYRQLCNEADIERVTDETIDRFMAVCGKHDLTVETIDHRDPQASS